MELTITETEEGHFKYKFVINEVDSKQIVFTKEVHECIKNHFKPKTKRKEKQPAPAPKLDDVRAYFDSKGYTIEAADKFHEYYETTSWRGANGTPILNWKGKALSVWFTDKNKIKKEDNSKSSFFRK